MSKDKSVLVCGIGEAASAAARRLFGEGHAVALYRATPPRLLRRRMSFADAWFDAQAQLDGVDVRRADLVSEFLLGLQTHNFIPLLRTRLSDVLERWPWDAIVAAREDEEPTPKSFVNLCELAIGLGYGFTAGVDCDLVIKTEGRDPGAILRTGDAPQMQRTIPSGTAEHYEFLAPRAGLVRATVSIGATLEAGEPLGFILDTPIFAPVTGRISGIARKDQAVLRGTPIIEIALSRNTRVAGISDKNQLVSHGVAFALEMESEGWKPFSFEDWL